MANGHHDPKQPASLNDIGLHGPNGFKIGSNAEWGGKKGADSYDEADTPCDPFGQEAMKFTQYGGLTGGSNDENAAYNQETRKLSIISFSPIDNNRRKPAGSFDDKKLMQEFRSMQPSKANGEASGNANGAGPEAGAGALGQQHPDEATFPAPTSNLPKKS